MSPVVSVVVPTYRRPRLLYRCLKAVLMQTLDGTRYEVIVADDGRCAHTREIVERLGRLCCGAPALRYLEPPAGARGPAAARNRGWQAARADLIAFTDDDTVPDPAWLAQGLHAMPADVAAAWGRIRVPISNQPTDYERNVKRLEEAEFATANCFVRRTALRAAGGFDERFKRAWREDADLYFTLLEMGERVVHAPAALVLHPVRAAPWGVSLTEQKNMLFDALLFKKHPRLYRSRIRAYPPLRYYAIVLCLIAVAAGLWAGSYALSLSGLAGWTALTGSFCLHRLAGTTLRGRHVLEMVFTSTAIPLIAVFWRLAGALRFRALFA